jgi:lipoprotein signal peptidase
MPERSYRIVLWTLALLGVSLDQATKYGVFAWLSKVETHSQAVFSTDSGGFQLVAQFQEGPDGKLMPHVNQGALFGFLKNYQTMANGGFAVVSLLAALAIGVWSMQPSTSRDRWLCAALGLILAGTLGNLYDRVVFNGVRDFLHWNYRFDWPVFNFADCCLVCGAGLLLIQAFTAAPAPKTAPETVSAPEMQAVAQTTQQS